MVSLIRAGVLSLVGLAAAPVAVAEEVTCIWEADGGAALIAEIDRSGRFWHFEGYFSTAAESAECSNPQCLSELREPFISGFVHARPIFDTASGRVVFDGSVTIEGAPGRLVLDRDTYTGAITAQTIAFPPPLPGARIDLGTLLGCGDG